MTKAEEFGKQMLSAVKGYVARALAPTVTRLDALAAQVAALPVAEKGDPGAKGDKGDPGESIKGDKGDPGKDGDPGRDAAELDILPSIDEEKSYRRGTWASHNGGLIRAERQTDAVTDGLIKAGWVVVVEGVSAIVVTQGEDPREIEVASMLTSGTKAIAPFRMPVVLDAGVYSAERDYFKGDGATWGGSWFIAQKDNPQGRPGESDDWRLAVKRGRDGKDFRPGEPSAVKVVKV